MSDDSSNGDWLWVVVILGLSLMTVCDNQEEIIENQKEIKDRIGNLEQRGDESSK